MSQSVTQTVDYPLDPLSSEEFTRVAAILSREHQVGDGWRIASVEMIEPGKAELAAFDDGGPMPPRRAAVTCLQCANNATYKGVVSLTDDSVESFEHIPGVQANFTVDEFLECDEMLRTHPDVQAALAKRGITDIDLVFMDTWTYGEAVAPPEHRDRRLGWSDTWVKAAPGANPYAHPVSGLHCVVDINSMELLRIEDNGGVEPPNVMGEYVPKHIPDHIRSASRREPLKALALEQPDGPTFTLEGNLLRWQNWSLRVGFNYREGMTLHSIRYRDGDRDSLGGTPDIAGRDDRALPRLVGGSLPANGIRHRRVGPGLHDDVTGAGVRLPGRDPLSRRGAAQQQG